MSPLGDSSEVIAGLLEESGAARLVSLRRCFGILNEEETEDLERMVEDSGGAEEQKRDKTPTREAWCNEIKKLEKKGFRLSF